MPHSSISTRLPGAAPALNAAEQPKITLAESPRRRPTREQGMGLEKLAHAIEYLMDSRLFRSELAEDDLCAVVLMMNCSRALFEECEEVVPAGTRLRRTLSRMLHPLPAA